ncbi:MAG: RecX family transcriptional regulator [bacterium]|nr:RecX family transcriptional regulator [bacterium]
MGQITSIKPQKSSKGRYRKNLPTGRQGRFNIFLDGKFAFAVSSVTLVKEELRVEQDLSQEEINKLVKENEFQKVYNRVINFLSYRPRSVKEIEDWCKKKEVGEEVKKQILPKLTKLGYLNDEEFAKWWIEQRMTFRPLGSKMIAFELRNKGVANETIAKLLNCYIAKDQEKELATKVIEKKLKALKGLSNLELRQKLSAHLARRGFSWEIIKEAVDDYLKKG